MEEDSIGSQGPEQTVALEEKGKRRIRKSFVIFVINTTMHKVRIIADIKF